jgi:hypothetical protein
MYAAVALPTRCSPPLPRCQQAAAATPATPAAALPAAVLPPVTPPCCRACLLDLLQT